MYAAVLDLFSGWKEDVGTILKLCIHLRNNNCSIKGPEFFLYPEKLKVEERIAHDVGMLIFTKIAE